MRRACARPGCADAATATFVYDYQARTTWLVQYRDPSDPRLFIPKRLGWGLTINLAHPAGNAGGGCIVTV